MVLAGTTRPLTGRQVHRLAGSGSQQGVGKVLLRLEETGLVQVAEAGAARLHWLNREHVACDAVLALIDLRGRLFDRIRRAVSAWAVQPLAASVFGSAARGDGDITSDIDLMFVRPSAIAETDPAWSGAIFDLGRSIHAWSGNRAGTHQATVEQIAEMIERQEPIIANLRRDELRLVGPGIFAAWEGG